MNTIWKSTRSELRPLFGVGVLLLLITAVAYPVIVTGIGQAVFNRQANGSLVKVDGEVVGSSLVGQQFTGSQYFQPRPSAAGAGYDAASSSGSNLGPTSAKLIEGVPDDPNTADVDETFAGIQQRVEAYREANDLPAGEAVPADAVTASGSGLDPHISPANARIQARRVAAARGIPEADVLRLVEEYKEERFLGLFGQARVNVLKLNIALDRMVPPR